MQNSTQLGNDFVKNLQFFWVCDFLKDIKKRNESIFVIKYNYPFRKAITISLCCGVVLSYSRTKT